MSVKIVTDSTCDLPEAVIKDLDITVMPLFINLDGKSYLDGVDLSREEFYRRLPESNPHPTTSAPGTGAFLQTYQRLAAEGADAVVSIHISKNLSNVCNVAELAAEEIEGKFPISVVDSGQLSLGLGLLVRSAARLAKEGAGVSEIAELLKDLAPRTFAYAHLNTIDYLRRSGRISNLQHSIASLLDMKPIMKMNLGAPKMEAARTLRRAVDRLVALVNELGPLEQVAFSHSGARAGVETLIERLRGLLPAQEAILISDTTPALGAHIGPGAVCVCCVTAQTPAAHETGRLAQIGRMIRSFTG